MKKSLPTVMGEVHCRESPFGKQCVACQFVDNAYYCAQYSKVLVDTRATSENRRVEDQPIRCEQCVKDFGTQPDLDAIALRVALANVTKLLDHTWILMKCVDIHGKEAAGAYHAAKELLK